MDQQSQIMHGEFVKFCDEFIKKAKCSKAFLAKKLDLEYTYFSKLYNGRRPLTEEILAQAKRLSQSQIEPNLDPEKAKIEEELPLDNAKIREEIASLQAIQDMDRKDKNELRERIAVLENALKEAKSDGEKKRWALEDKYSTLKYDIERIEDRLSRGSREANGR